MTTPNPIRSRKIDFFSIVLVHRSTRAMTVVWIKGYRAKPVQTEFGDTLSLGHRFVENIR